MAPTINLDAISTIRRASMSQTSASIHSEGSLTSGQGDPELSTENTPEGESGKEISSSQALAARARALAGSHTTSSSANSSSSSILARRGSKAAITASDDETEIKTKILTPDEKHIALDMDAIYSDKANLVGDLAAESQDAALTGVSPSSVFNSMPNGKSPTEVAFEAIENVKGFFQRFSSTSQPTADES
jgi:hypothetical protein